MIIAISGKLSAGKDTAARPLQEEWKFQKANFTDPLKQIINRVYDIPYSVLYGPSDLRNTTKLSAETDKLVREGLQTLGTWGRNNSTNTWVRLWQREVSKLVKDGYSVVCTDARYLNELDAVREIGGVNIRIRRAAFGEHADWMQHSSETDQDEIPDSYFDEVIINDKDIGHLESAICDVFVRRISSNH